ncbi:hypothetical protein QCA50_013645 [Cerrena zonata]|uniref:Uncharacterized protein n=1 Tax=Cerrena zonata TaxID=2478898 RepID=A0AAW0FQP5_9APHY
MLKSTTLLLDNYNLKDLASVEPSRLVPRLGTSCTDDSVAIEFLNTDMLSNSTDAEFLLDLEQASPGPTSDTIFATSARN